MTTQPLRRTFNAFLLAACLGALSVGLPGLQGGGAAHAQEHQVDRKSGQVEKNDTIDNDDEESVVGTILTIDNGQVELSSPLFTPPGNRVFKQFSGTDTHVDIELDPAGSMPSRDPDDPDEIQISAMITVDNAGPYPLRGEGNLASTTSGGGGGPSPGERWAAKMDIPDLTLHIVPARDLNGTADGRGEVPNIPKNAVLPAMLSGTDEANEVKVAVRAVFSEPLSSDLELDLTVESGDTNKATITNPQVTFTVPAGRTEYYSNGDDGGAGGPYTDADRTAVVVGGVLSENNTDTVEITANPGETTGVAATSKPANLLRYEFVFEKVAGGAVETVEDPEIVGNQVTNTEWTKSTVPYGTIAPQPNDLQPFDTVMGAERWSDNHAVMAERINSTPIGGVTARFERVGGGALSAWDDGGSPWISYHRTSAFFEPLYFALAAEENEVTSNNPGPQHWWLASIPGTMSFDIELANETDQIVVHPDEPAAGRNRIIVGGTQDDTEFWSWKIFGSGDSIAPGDPPGDRWDETDTTKGHIKSGSTLYIVASSPSDGFSGKAASRIEASREASYAGVLGRPRRRAFTDWAVEDLLKVGIDAVTLNWSSVVKGAVDLSTTDGKVASEVAASASFALDLNGDTVEYLDNGEPTPLTENEGVVLARDNEDPSKVYEAMVATTSDPFREFLKEGDMPALEANSSTSYVFAIPLLSDGHHVSAVTTAATAVRKHVIDGYAEMRLTVTEIEIGPEGGEFEIVELN